MNNSIDSRIQNVVEFFEDLSRENLGRIREIYSENARFIDPFNEVAGIPAIVRIYEDMYERCDSARFDINEKLALDNIAYVRWEFQYRPKGKLEEERTIEGVSRLVFDHDGRVKEHTDYWDAARQVYERLPVVGTILRYLRKRIGSETDI